MNRRIVLVTVAILSLGSVIAAWNCWLPGTCGACRGEVSVTHRAVRIEKTDLVVPGTETDLYLVKTEVRFNCPDVGGEWIAPAGILTDGASVPERALSLTGPPAGPRILRPAIVHDAYCQSSSKCEQYLRSRPCDLTHRMFYEACVCSGANPTEAYAWWAAVYVGGPRWDEQGNVLPSLLDEASYAVISRLLRLPEKAPRSQWIKDGEEMAKKWSAEEAFARTQIEDVVAREINEKRFEAADQALENVLQRLDREAKQDRDNEVVYLAIDAATRRRAAALWGKTGEFRRSLICLEGAVASHGAVLKECPDDPLFQERQSVSTSMLAMLQIQQNHEITAPHVAAIEARLNALNSIESAQRPDKWDPNAPQASRPLPQGPFDPERQKVLLGAVLDDARNVQKGAVIKYDRRQLEQFLGSTLADKADLAVSIPEKTVPLAF